MDSDVAKQTVDIRHVRDMWLAAAAQSHALRLAELAIGMLVVTRRPYTINGEPMIIPGHIGIITSLDEYPSFIHASAGTGRVEERPLRTLNTVLGYIAITF